MIVPDVNILIYAMRKDSAHHEPVSRWLVPRLAGDEVVGISEMVLSSLVRITTNHRIFAEPSTPEQAMDFCAVLRAAPSTIPIRSGPRHWAIFDRLVTQSRCRGNDVADAYLAAMAIEQGATWISHDRGFRRFPGLRLCDPLDG